MLLSRATTRLSRSATSVVMPGKSSMCGRVGWQIMIGMPKQPVVVFRPIFLGVVDINIGNVPGQIVHQFKPSPVSGQGELAGEAVNGVVLVVVMGNQRSFARGLIKGFVVGKYIAEVAPPVLVDDFSFLEKIGGAVEP